MPSRPCARSVSQALGGQPDDPAQQHQVSTVSGPFRSRRPSLLRRRRNSSAMASPRSTRRLPARHDNPSHRSTKSCSEMKKRGDPAVVHYVRVDGRWLLPPAGRSAMAFAFLICLIEASFPIGTYGSVLGMPGPAGYIIRQPLNQAPARSHAAGGMLVPCRGGRQSH